MGAPSAGIELNIPVGTLKKCQLKRPAFRRTRLRVAVTAGWSVLSLVRVIFGVVYFYHCPLQPKIPFYLFGLVLIPVILMSLVTIFSDLQRSPQAFRTRLMIMYLFMLTWTVAGYVWILSVYKPNYEPSVGLFCNKNLYTFAFWNAMFETFLIGFLLGGGCEGLLCQVEVNPEPSDVYGHV